MVIDHFIFKNFHMVKYCQIIAIYKIFRNLSRHGWYFLKKNQIFENDKLAFSTTRILYRKHLRSLNKTVVFVFSTSYVDC